MYLSVWAAVFLLGFCWAEESRLSVCPQMCDCKGLTVDCANRQLKAVPRPIPKEAKRINLEGNNITVIRADDFEGLNQVQIMQLMENQIHLIEKGAFQDLVSMERLRLNNNRLRSLPDLLFSTMPNLLRLCLSAAIVIRETSLQFTPSLLGESVNSGITVAYTASV